MRALLFDVETTGLVLNRTLKNDKLPEVIEFYGCIADLETGEIEREFDTLVKPKMVTEVPEKVTKITGLTIKDLQTSKPFEQVADEIDDLIRDSEAVYGHNISFDCEMIDIEMDRVARKVAWPRKVCTVEQTIHIRGHRLNLATLHELLFGVGFKGAHRAREDVHALLRCVVEMRRREWL